MIIAPIDEVLANGLQRYWAADPVGKAVRHYLADERFGIAPARQELYDAVTQVRLTESEFLNRKHSRDEQLPVREKRAALQDSRWTPAKGIRGSTSQSQSPFLEWLALLALPALGVPYLVPSAR
jgi:hypothetical protein